MKQQSSLFPQCDLGKLAEVEAEAARTAQDEEPIEAARDEHARGTDVVALAMQRHGTTDAIRRICSEAQRELQASLPDATYSTYLHIGMPCVRMRGYVAVIPQAAWLIGR
jgi:hypothetical protein